MQIQRLTLTLHQVGISKQPHATTALLPAKIPREVYWRAGAIADVQEYIKFICQSVNNVTKTKKSIFQSLLRANQKICWCILNFIHDMLGTFKKGHVHCDKQGKQFNILRTDSKCNTKIVSIVIEFCRSDTLITILNYCSIDNYRK